MITQLTLQDAERVTHLLQSAEFLDPTDIQTMVAALISAGANERWIGYEFSGRLSGLAYISESDGVASKWAIKFMYVKPEMRGMGISKTLMKYAEMEQVNWMGTACDPDTLAMSQSALLGRWGYVYL